MNALERKILLMRAGLLQIEIARKVGCSTATVSRNIDGKQETPEVRRTIALELGLRVDELWPPAAA